MKTCTSIGQHRIKPPWYSKSRIISLVSSGHWLMHAWRKKHINGRLLFPLPVTWIIVLFLFPISSWASQEFTQQLNFSLSPVSLVGNIVNHTKIISSLIMIPSSLDLLTYMGCSRDMVGRGEWGSNCLLSLMALRGSFQVRSSLEQWRTSELLTGHYPISVTHKATQIQLQLLWDQQPAASGVWKFPIWCSKNAPRYLWNPPLDWGWFRTLRSYTQHIRGLKKIIFQWNSNSYRFSHHHYSWQLSEQVLTL